MPRDETKFVDINGNCLHIGDSVVYSQASQGSSWLARGVIIRETPKKLELQPLECRTVFDRNYPGFYRPVDEPAPPKMLGPWKEECINICLTPPWAEVEEFRRRGWL